MATEIERKFLVIGDFKSLATNSYRIRQGYISAVPERTVRIRTKGDMGFITIKGVSSVSGLSRYEWEKEIPLLEALELLQLCENGIIDKIRHIVPCNGSIYEVDEFLGENEGLFLAEIELDTEQSTFSKPPWLGQEVTGDNRYYNSYISQYPYKSWSIDLTF